jgi:RTA1 like protein
MAASWETASFVFRVLGTMDPRTALYNILSQILVILAPLWINAFAYMVMGRLIYYWLPTKSLWGIKARKMTKFFVWLDIGTFLVQLVGGGMLSSDEASQVKLGMKICKVAPGLCINHINHLC